MIVEHWVAHFTNIPPRESPWLLIIFHGAVKEARDDSIALHTVGFSLEVFPMEAAFFCKSKDQLKYYSIASLAFLCREFREVCGFLSFTHLWQKLQFGSRRYTGSRLKSHTIRGEALSWMIILKSLREKHQFKPPFEIIWTNCSWHFGEQFSIKHTLTPLHLSPDIEIAMGYIQKFCSSLLEQ